MSSIPAASQIPAAEPIPPASPLPKEEPIPPATPLPEEEPIPAASPMPEEEPIPPASPIPEEESIPPASPIPEEDLISVQRCRMHQFFKFIILFLFCILLKTPALGAEMPRVGAKAPVFTLKDQSEHNISLRVFRGKWVVLYFYSKDISPGCSLEAYNFQRDILNFTEKNAEVVGISDDPPEVHRKFCEDEELTFTLLSDEKQAVTDLYGSLLKDRKIRLSNRNTFIIDPHGIIRKIYTSVNPAKHSTEILSDLEKIQTGQQ